MSEKITITPTTIYDHLPYLATMVAEVINNLTNSPELGANLAEITAWENHDAEVIADLFDMAINLPDWHPHVLAIYVKIVCRNHDNNWTTDFTPSLVEVQ